MMDFLNSLEELKFSIWVREAPSIWAFPTFLLLHTLGMSIVAGLSAMLDMVLLGFWPKVPIKPLERLYPLMWTGFWINLVTGTVLLMADATTKLANWDLRPSSYPPSTFATPSPTSWRRCRRQAIRR